MIAHLLRAAPFPVTAFGILGGIALIASGRLPLAVAGAALIVLGLLVPLLRLAFLGDEPPRLRPGMGSRSDDADALARQLGLGMPGIDLPDPVPEEGMEIELTIGKDRVRFDTGQVTFVARQRPHPSPGQHPSSWGWSSLPPDREWPEGSVVGPAAQLFMPVGPRLVDREAVLRMALAGRPVESIAQELGISTEEVEQKMAEVRGELDRVTRHGAPNVEHP